MDNRTLMPTTRWGQAADPLATLRRDLDRMFEGFGAGWGLPATAVPTGYLTPKVDVAETAAGLEVTAEMPGVDPKDVVVELDDDVLTLRAEHTAERKEDNAEKKYHVMERTTGTFLRRFALPFATDPAKVTATFDKGVLTIAVPRSGEAAKPARRIEVKGPA